MDEEVGSPVGHMVISLSAGNFPLFILAVTAARRQGANVLCFCLAVILITASHPARLRGTEAVHTRLKSTFAVNNCARTLSKGNKRFDTITCVRHSFLNSLVRFPLFRFSLFSLFAVPLGSLSSRWRIVCVSFSGIPRADAIASIFLFRSSHSFHSARGK